MSLQSLPDRQTAGRGTSISRPPRVSVIIPTRNEAENLPLVLAELPAEYEVIIVDGHSTDGSVDVAHALRPDARIFTQTRCGKGNAMACGFAAATGDILVMLDADGSADPHEIPRFIEALIDGADFAKGTRFAPGGGSNDITMIRRGGNRVLNGLVNLCYGTHYTDLCYGYNAFWRRCLPAIHLEPGPASDEMRWGDGFEVETLMNVRVAQAGLKVVEVPSFELDRINGASNLHAFRDGMRVLRTIAAERRHESAGTGLQAEHRPVVIDLLQRQSARSDREGTAARAAVVHRRVRRHPAGGGMVSRSWIPGRSLHRHPDTRVR